MTIQNAFFVDSNAQFWLINFTGFTSRFMETSTTYRKQNVSLSQYTLSGTLLLCSGWIMMLDALLFELS